MVYWRGKKTREALKAHQATSPRTVQFLIRIGQAPRPQRPVRGHIAQLPVGELQAWKEAQAVGLPGPGWSSTPR